MANWLRYFFGSFFFDGEVRRGNSRSVFNSLLGLLLVLIIFVSAFIAGYAISFYKTYASADDFKLFMANMFEQDEFSFQIEDSLAIGDILINTYVNETDANYSAYGYQLVVDLRDIANTYDDFEIVCASENGNISYEEYKKLSSAAKSFYNVSVMYSGKPLDIYSDELQSEYTEYLDLVSDVSSSLYDQEIAASYAEINGGSDEEKEEIYLLYISAYYSDIDVSESEVDAPTLEGYYISLKDKDTDGKFLYIFSDYCECSFGEKIKCYFIGYYSGLEGETISAAVGDSMEISSRFIKKCFTGSYLLYIILYFSNSFSSLLFMVILWVIISIVYYIVGKRRKIEPGFYFLHAMQATGSFLFMSGVIAAVFSVIISLFVAQEVVYTIAVLSFYLIYYLRCVVFVVIEALRKVDRKERTDYKEDFINNVAGVKSYQ